MLMKGWRKNERDLQYFADIALTYLSCGYSSPNNESDRREVRELLSEL